MADNQPTPAGQTPSGDGPQPGATPKPEGLTPEGKPQTPPITAKTEISALPDDIQDYIKRLRSEAEEANKKVKSEADTKRKADEALLIEQNKFKELAEQRARDLEEANKKLAQRDRSLLVSRLVAKHKLPEDLADMLIGDTEVDLEASAAKLAKHVKLPTAANTEAGSRQQRAGEGAGGGANQQAGQGQVRKPYAFQQPGEVAW